MDAEHQGSSGRSGQDGNYETRKSKEIGTPTEKKKPNPTDDEDAEDKMVSDKFKENSGKEREKKSISPVGQAGTGLVSAAFVGENGSKSGESNADNSTPSFLNSVPPGSSDQQVGEDKMGQMLDKKVSSNSQNFYRLQRAKREKRDGSHAKKSQGALIQPNEQTKGTPCLVTSSPPRSHPDCQAIIDEIIRKQMFLRRGRTSNTEPQRKKPTQGVSYVTSKTSPRPQQRKPTNRTSSSSSTPSSQHHEERRQNYTYENQRPLSSSTSMFSPQQYEEHRKGFTYVPYVNQRPLPFPTIASSPQPQQRKPTKRIIPSSTSTSSPQERRQDYKDSTCVTYVNQGPLPSSTIASSPHPQQRKPTKRMPSSTNTPSLQQYEERRQDYTFVFQPYAEQEQPLDLSKNSENVQRLNEQQSFYTQHNRNSQGNRNRMFSNEQILTDSNFQHVDSSPNMNRGISASGNQLAVRDSRAVAPKISLNRNRFMRGDPPANMYSHHDSALRNQPAVSGAGNVAPSYRREERFPRMHLQNNPSLRNRNRPSLIYRQPKTNINENHPTYNALTSGNLFASSNSPHNLAIGERIQTDSHHDVASGNYNRQAASGSGFVASGFAPREPLSHANSPDDIALINSNELAGNGSPVLLSSTSGPSSSRGKSWTSINRNPHTNNVWSSGSQLASSGRAPHNRANREETQTGESIQQVIGDAGNGYTTCPRCKGTIHNPYLAFHLDLCNPSGKVTCYND